MAEKRVVYVLLPTGSKAEAVEARKHLASDDVSLVMCSRSSHTAGQRIVGDVVVVGNKPPTIEDDTSGKVYHVADMADLDGLDTKLVRRARAVAKHDADDAEAAAADVPAETPVPLPHPGQSVLTPQQENEDASEDAPAPDETEGKSRVELIQHAAKNWPGRQRWATMTNEQLVEAIHELEASD